LAVQNDNEKIDQILYVLHPSLSLLVTIDLKSVVFFIAPPYELECIGRCDASTGKDAMVSL
jgi:hypothetical protein